MNISQELLSSQQVYSTLTGDSGNCEVNIELPDKQHSDVLPDQQNEAEETVDSMSESQLEGDSQKTNNNSLENMTPDTSNSKEDVIGNSSPKAADCSTEVDSQGKIQLSEFDETVDYNTGEMSDEGNSSSSSSSGRSEDESDRDQPVNKRQKPDLSLRPPLITKSTGNTRKPKPKPKPRPSFMRQKPQRVQPSRAKKNMVQYIPFASDSDSDSSEHDSKHDDFVPEGEEG